MRANTIVKLGSLALDVAQDEKIRELATMIHKGAKRRGLLAAPAPPPSTAGQNTTPAAPAKPSPSVPFAPANHPAVQNQPGQIGIEKWLTADNAKKALSWAGMIKDVLMK